MSKEDSDVKYVCIHCGKEAHQLYRLHPTSGVLSLERCDLCGDVVDKYVEYDPVLILLDALLYRLPVYRHVLLNVKNKSVVRWSLIIVTVELYYRWICAAAAAAVAPSGGQSLTSSSGGGHEERVLRLARLTTDHGLLALAAVNTSQSIVYLCSLSALVFASQRLHLLQPNISLRTLLGHLLVSSYARLLYLPLIFWRLQGRGSVEGLIGALVAASHLQALRAVHTGTRHREVVCALSVLTAVGVQWVCSWSVRALTTTTT